MIARTIPKPCVAGSNPAGGTFLTCRYSDDLVAVDAERGSQLLRKPRNFAARGDPLVEHHRRPGAVDLGVSL